MKMKKQSVMTRTAKSIAMLTVMTSAMVTMASNANAELVIQNTPGGVAAIQQISTATLWQNQPSDASLDKLVKVLHVDSMVDEMIAQRQQAADIMKGLPNEFPIDNNAGIFSRHAQKQIKNIFTKYGAVLGQQLDQPQSKQQLIEVYKNIAKKTYTQDEVNALNQFYETPMGQSILVKQNQVSMAFVQVMMPTMLGDTTDLQKALPTLQKDIEKIFK